MGLCVKKKMLLPTNHLKKDLKHIVSMGNADLASYAVINGRIAAKFPNAITTYLSHYRIAIRRF